MKKVAVGIIERETDGQRQFLLISATKDFGKFTGFYYPPGGHMEDGESESETISREIKEELGFNVEVTTKIAETLGDIKEQVTYWWLCKIVGGKQRIQKEEIADARWFTEGEIIKEEKIWPATRKVFLDYIFKSQN